MRIDVDKSMFHEHENARNEFNRKELRSLRLLLRRLRFLETRVRENGGLADGPASGGAAFAEWEMEALEMVLSEVGFLVSREEQNNDSETS